jgi:parallel beta-helix repeat protein
MKTNFNQLVGWEAVARITAVVCFLIFPVLAPATEPVSLTFPVGVSEIEIQKALDALPAVGGEVVLPAGKFFIRQPIVLRRDNQVLRGSGAATILRLADNANCPVIIMGEPVNAPKNIVHNLRVSDLFIDGNRKNQTRELWRLEGEGSEIRNNGITIQAVSDCVVERVVSAHNRSGGLVTTMGVECLTVRGLESFDNEFDGLACYLTTDSLFTDLYLHDNPGAGISLDLAFNNNVISNAVLNGNDLGVFMRSSSNNQFVNVAIHNSHHHGVFIAHAETQTPFGWGPAPMTECTHNSFTNLIAVNCGGAAFRVNNSTCTNNTLIRAMFNGNVKGGISQPLPDLVTVQ